MSIRHAESLVGDTRHGLLVLLLEVTCTRCDIGRCRSLRTQQHDFILQTWTPEVYKGSMFQMTGSIRPGRERDGDPNLKEPCTVGDW